MMNTVNKHIKWKRRVKALCEIKSTDLQRCINKFIEDAPSGTVFSDIKFSTCLDVEQIYFSALITYDVPEIKKRDEISLLAIDDARTRTLLYNSKYSTLQDIWDAKVEDVQEIRNFGWKAFKELLLFIVQCGYDPHEWFCSQGYAPHLSEDRFIGVCRLNHNC